jgi:hypothetical protein
MSDKTDITNLIDKINIKDLIEFLEYEEAMTKDASSGTRIRIFLISLGIWNLNDTEDAK